MSDDNKIAIAACSGMSPNGLISRVASSDYVCEHENIISICMGATSGDRAGFRKLIKKYPIIAVNGCSGACVNSILKQRDVDVVKTINIDEVLSSEKIKANDVSRLDETGEKCVNIIKNQISKIIKEI